MEVGIFSTYLFTEFTYHKVLAVNNLKTKMLNGLEVSQFERSICDMIAKI